MSIYNLSVRLAGGGERKLADYRDKVILIVNVASKCEFTPQYKGLQSLYEKFGPHGFEVLAFPCNQFDQPESDADIAAFCVRNYGVTFPLFAKIEVNGINAHPLFVWLKHKLPSGGIQGYFTKFLLDRAGAVRGRWPPTIPPEALWSEVAAQVARGKRPTVY